MDKNIKFSSTILNANFETNAIAQSSVGWLGDENSHIYFLPYGDVNAVTSFDDQNKKSGKYSLRLQVNSLGEKNENLILIRLDAEIKAKNKNDEIVPWDKIKEEYKKLKFNLSFFANTNFSPDIGVHKFYITRKLEEHEMDVPSLCEEEFELDTNNEWVKVQKEFEVSTDDFENSFHIYICLGYGSINSNGIGNFDDFDLEILLPNTDEEKTQEFKDNIDFNTPNLNPIPKNVRDVLEEFLNSKSITDFELEGLRNDPTFSFAAMMELWKRENIDIKEFLAFVDQNHKKSEKEIITFFEENGITLESIKSLDEKKTLGTLIVDQTGQSTAELLIFYIKVLLFGISKNGDTYINMPAEESAPQLLELINGITPQLNSINQLRTLETLKNILTSDTQDNLVQNDNNVYEAATSLLETKKITQEIEDSIALAVEELVDYLSKTLIPFVELSIGSTPLSYRSQQKMNFILMVLNALNKTPEGEYSVNSKKWFEGFFGVGGGLINTFLAEEVNIEATAKYANTAIATGLQKYSTLDVDLPLTNYISSTISDDLKKFAYEKPSRFRTLGELFTEMVGGFALATTTLLGDRRDKDDIETIFRKKVEQITDDAVKNGFVDKDGNYHPPKNMDDETRNFLASTAGTAAYEGLNSSREGLDYIPGSLGRTANLNPFGSFDPHHLGAVSFPDAEKGISNLPFKFSPSIENRFAQGVKDVLPASSIAPMQRLIGERPELFQNSRFDGSFKNFPEFKNTMAAAGISDYRLPQMQDSINKAFGMSNLDRVSGPIPRLSAIGNEFIGNIDKRLGVPFNQNYSPLGNMLPLAALPFAAGASLLGKSGVPNMPGNPDFYREFYGPKALASKGIPLPTNYSPEAMRNLLRYEAPFASPIMLPKGYRDDGGVIMPSFTPQQLQDYQNYQAAAQQAQAPQYSPEQIRQFQEYQKAQQRQKYTPEQIEAYKRARAAQKAGNYGKNTPQNSQARQNYERAMKAQQEGQKRTRDISLGGAGIGVVLGSLLGGPPLVISMTLFGAGAQTIIGNWILGNGKKDSKYTAFLETVGQLAGFSGISHSLRAVVDPTGRNVQMVMTRANNLWNKTLGRVFGYDMETGSVVYDRKGRGREIQGIDFTSAENRLNAASRLQVPQILNEINQLYGGKAAHFYNQGLFFQQLFIQQSQFNSSSAEFLKHDYNAEFAYNLKRNFNRFFKLQFSNGAYLDQMGLLDNIVRIKSFSEHLGGLSSTADIQKAIDEYYAGTISEERIVTSGKRSYAEKKLPKILGGFSTIRTGLGSIWSGFFGLTSPITGKVSGFAGTFNYFFSSIPRSAIYLTSGVNASFQGLYMLIPNRMKAYFKFGKAFDIERVVFVNGKALSHRVFDQRTGKWVLRSVTRKVGVGYRTKFGAWFSSKFRKYLGQNVYARTGFMALFLGEEKKVFNHFLTRQYFSLTGKIGGALSIFSNPEAWAQAKLKEMFFRLMVSLSKRITFAFVKGFIRSASALFRAMGVQAARAVTLTFGLGCVFLGVLMIAIMIASGAIFSATTTSYGQGTGGKGAATTEGSTGAVNCLGVSSTTATDEKGNVLPAKVLDVPYFNQVMDTSGTKIAVAGGGNMCGAASATMVAGYYHSVPLANHSPIDQLQNYMYKDEGQGETFGLPYYPGNLSCTSTSSYAGTNPNVQGAFYVTSGGGCNESSYAGIKAYLEGKNRNVRVAPQQSFVGADRIRINTVLYPMVKASIDNGNPVIFGFTAPWNHISLIIGYTYDNNTQAVTGVVVNDPFRNVMISGNSYTNAGKGAVYRLDEVNVNTGVPLFSLGWFAPMEKANSSVSTGVACTPVDDGSANGDKKVDVGLYKQKYTLSCETASLNIILRSLKLIDTNALAEVTEDQIISKLPTPANTPLVLGTPGVGNKPITSWGNPEKEFVGNINGTSIRSFFNCTSTNASDCSTPTGYGVHSPVINTIAKTYTQNTSTTRSSNYTDGASLLEQLKSGVDRGAPSVVWIPTEFATFSSSQLTDYINYKNSGKFKWNSPTGEVNMIPDEHAAVFMGYNNTTKEVIIMDVADGTQKRVPVDRFIQAWSLLDFQSVTISK